MARITVVIEGATEAISLGMTLAGGKVCAASEGSIEVNVELEAGLLALADNIGPNCTAKVLSAMYQSRNR